jgi:potassium-dependent mechanosensitive channel
MIKFVSMFVALSLLFLLFAAPVLAQQTPAASSAQTEDDEVTNASSEEGVKMLRDKLEEEKIQLSETAQEAQKVGNQQLVGRFTQELDLLSRLDLLYLQQLSAMQRYSELEGAKTQVLNDRVAAGNAANQQSAPTFAYLESLRDQLSAEQERQAQEELNIKSARRALEDAAVTWEEKERARRQAKEELGLTAEIELKAEREAAYNFAVLESRVQKQLVEVRTQELSNLELSLEVSRLRGELLERQIKQVKPFARMSDEDLQVQLEQIDQKEKTMRRQLDETKSVLSSCERKFFEAKKRSISDTETDTSLGEEIEAQRLCRDMAREEIGILGEQIYLLATLREIYNRRYKLQNGKFSGPELDQLRKEIALTIEGMAQRSRMQNARLAGLRRDVKNITGKIDTAGAENRAVVRWLTEQRSKLRKASLVYAEYVDDNEAVRKAAEKLQTELREEEKELALYRGLQKFWSAVSAVWVYELFSVEDHPITVHKIIIALIIVVIGLRVSGRLSQKFASRVLPHLGMNAGEAAAFEALVFYGLIVFFVLFALHVVHVPLTVFTLLGGAVAIGVGFGSQNIMNNFISGLILLLERPIRVGDLVEVDTFQGRVLRIGARSTRIVTFNNIDLVVPNSLLLEKNVVNWTLSDEMARSQIAVGAAYGSDPEKVKTILLSVVQQHPYVLDEPEPFAVLSEFGESTLVFKVYFWLSLSAAKPRPVVESDLRCTIERVFREQGITIPVPQRNIQVETKNPVNVRVIND